MASCVAVASPISAEFLGSGGDDVGGEAEYDEIEVEKGDIEEEIQIEAKDVADIALPKETEKISGMKTSVLEHDPVKRESKFNDDNQKLVSENEKSLKKNHVEDAKDSILDGFSPTKRNGIVVTDTETTPTTSKAKASKHASPRLPGTNSKSKKSRSRGEHGGSKKKINVPCQFYAKGWCIKGSLCRFLHVKDGLQDPKLSSETTMSTDLHRMVGRVPLHVGNVSSFEGYSSAPLLREGFSDMAYTSIGNILACSSVLHDPRSGLRIPTFGTRSNEDKHGLVSHGNPLLDSSVINQPVSFNATPWSKNFHAALGNCHDYLESSFPRNPLFSSLEFGGASQHNLIVDREPPVHDAKFSSYAWEPSIPFEPSHALTRNLLMKEFPQGIQGNGAGETHLRDGQLKSSFSDQVSTSLKDLNARSDGSAGKDNFEDAAQTGETVGAQPMGSSHDSGSRVEKLNNEVQVKVDAVLSKDESEVGFKGEDQMSFEAKALMCFKAALAEYVKELVKPTWREGLMSKDAHKLIVKKSVDKVMSTIQPYQIPVTDEAIQSYLSASHSKLAKLVKAYIERHGKS